MIMLEDFEGASCTLPGVDVLLFDPDTHDHLRLGKNTCWLCEEAEEVCADCPLWEKCYAQAKKFRESYMICAGMLWSSGHPRDVRKRRT